MPYKGAGPALNDMLGGRGDFMVTTLPSVLGLMNSGDMVAAGRDHDRARRLAEGRSDDRRERLSRLRVGRLVRVRRPKGTPAPIVEKLRTATVEALAAPTVKERLEAEGAVIVGDTPQDFGDMMKAESQRWASFLTEAGISID